MVYKATVRTNNSTKYYISAREGTFKQRIYAHKLSFSNKKYSNNTTLSAYIWKLKDKNITPSVNWEVIKAAPVYNKISRSLPCLHENVTIITHPSQYRLLSYKPEIISKCRYENKYFLIIISIFPYISIISVHFTC